MKEDLLPTMVTIDQGDLVRIVITSWNEDLLDVDHLMHRRSLFSGRAQTCRGPIQRVKFTKAIAARHTKIRDQNPSLGYICPGEPHPAQPQRSKIGGSVSGGDRVARARCPRSSVEAGQKCDKN